MQYKKIIAIVVAFSALAANAAVEAKKIDPKTGLVIYKGFELVSTQCTVCHNSKLILQNPQDRNTWKETIVWMQETQNL